MERRIRVKPTESTKQYIEETEAKTKKEAKALIDKSNNFVLISVEDSSKGHHHLECLSVARPGKYLVYLVRGVFKWLDQAKQVIQEGRKDD